MRARGADFYVSLGDMPYADKSSFSIADYWNRHKLTRDDYRFRNFAWTYPIEAVWDDHEVTDDWDSTALLAFVGWGKQSFFDFFPFPDGSKEIYRRCAGAQESSCSCWTPAPTVATTTRPRVRASPSSGPRRRPG